jgi:hypothetical protein
MPDTAATPPRKSLDIVVKLGLGVLVGAFALIWGGMFLTRPDRSIPPFSIGSQEGEVVAAHVPPWTTDQQIETLLARFRKVGHQTHDFAKMKIRPTTPGDKAGRYRRIVVYVFASDGWAEPEMLHKFLAGDPDVRMNFAKAVRGTYRLDDQNEEGWLGPIALFGEAAPTTRLLFKGRVTDPLPQNAEGEPGLSLSPL